MIFHQISYNMCNKSGYKNNKKALRFRADQYDVRHWQSKLSSFINIYQQLFYDSDPKTYSTLFFMFHDRIVKVSAKSNQNVQNSTWSASVACVLADLGKIEIYLGR